MSQSVTHLKISVRGVANTFNETKAKGEVREGEMEGKGKVEAIRV